MTYIGNQDVRNTVLSVGTIKGVVANAAALSAIVAPVVGALYIAQDTGNGHLYSESGWVDLGLFRGPQGLAGLDGQKVDHVVKTAGTGENGTSDTYTLWADPTETVLLGTFDVYNGKDGKSWITGTAVPLNADGNENDLYFNMSTNHYYRKESGVWTLKGTLRGESFSTNASGTLVGRAAYDSELTGFGYTVLDAAVPTLYFKLSDTVGDWDLGTAVGKGVGISTIVKTDTVGNVDTYTITYDDTSTSTFEITNANIDDTVAALDKTWSSTKISEEFANVQASLNFDSIPTEGSTNPVTSDGVFEAIAANKATDINIVSVAVNTAMVASTHYVVTADATILTLPITPSIGNKVIVSVGDFYNTTVARNGSNIMGLAEDMKIDTNNTTVEMQYINSTEGWRLV